MDARQSQAPQRPRRHRSAASRAGRHGNVRGCGEPRVLTPDYRASCRSMLV
jgi:hypothetical protein